MKVGCFSKGVGGEDGRPQLYETPDRPAHGPCTWTTVRSHNLVLCNATGGLCTLHGLVSGTLVFDKR